MKRLTEDEVIKNWEKLLAVVNATFESNPDRRDRILKMLEYFEERLSLCPASAKEHFHNAWPGGLVDHTLRVIKNGLKLYDVWKEAGASINFTKEEVVFAGIFHDLAKVGDLEVDYYIPNESEWHRQHQGKIYELNPKLNFMNVTDRTFFLMNHFGIDCTTNEFLAIRLADGMYFEANKAYLAGYDDAFRLKTNLPHIIHQADMLSMVVEYDAWKHSPDGGADPKPKSNSKTIQRKKTLVDTFIQQPEATKFDPKIFDEVFPNEPGEKK